MHVHVVICVSVISAVHTKYFQWNGTLDGADGKVVENAIVDDTADKWSGEGATVPDYVDEEATPLQKCCPQEQAFTSTDSCQNVTGEITLHVEFYTGDMLTNHRALRLTKNKGCGLGELWIPLMPEIISEDEYFVQKSGKLYLPYYEEQFTDTFCVENYVDDFGEVSTIVLMCMREDSETAASDYCTLGMY